MGLGTNAVKECILCGSASIKLEQELRVNDLLGLYRSEFGLDVGPEFESMDSVSFYSCKACHLEFFDPKTAGSGLFYEQLQNSRKEVYYNPERIEFSYAKQYIAKEDTILEIGSGSGFFAEMIPDNAYVGLEYNDKAIADAAKKGITLKKQSVEDHSKEAMDLYDIVCSFHVMEHVTNAFDFIEASVKLLKPGGKMIVSVPCNDSLFTSNLNHTLNLPPHHTIRWNMSSMQRIAELFELDIIGYEIHGSENPSLKKNYLKMKVLKRFARIMHPRNKVLIEPRKMVKLRRYADLMVNKLRLHNLVGPKIVIGENMTFVFQKKNRTSQ